MICENVAGSLTVPAITELRTLPMGGSLGAQEPLWDRLHGINIPVLWIGGEKDTKFLSLVQRAVSLRPDACLAIAPGAGHRVPSEAEAWFGENVTHIFGRETEGESL